MWSVLALLATTDRAKGAHILIYHRVICRTALTSIPLVRCTLLLHTTLYSRMELLPMDCHLSLILLLVTTRHMPFISITRRHLPMINALYEPPSQYLHLQHRLPRLKLRRCRTALASHCRLRRYPSHPSLALLNHHFPQLLRRARDCRLILD